ncbi:MAG: hypothetical protein BA863_13275 [Desulfovibrio sp. S3730MH75]|nr:MAG: hypothetical protein BA863_13275 [Desulfovibrio sp. S3730MH75]
MDFRKLNLSKKVITGFLKIMDKKTILREMAFTNINMGAIDFHYKGYTDEVGEYFFCRVYSFKKQIKLDLYIVYK